MELSVQVKLNIRQVLSYLTVKGFVLCFVAWQVIAPSCLLGWIAAAQNIHNESVSVSEDGTSRGTSKPCVGSVK